jgi:hypothetical protein
LLIIRDIHCFFDSLINEQQYSTLNNNSGGQIVLSEEVFLTKQRGTIHQLVFVSVPPSNLITNKQRIVHTQSVRTSSLLVLGDENWRYSRQREQEPKAPYLYLSRTNGTPLRFMIYDFLFMICVRLVNSHIITNLRESVCPGLLHRQFVFR